MTLPLNNKSPYLKTLKTWAAKSCTGKITRARTLGTILDFKDWTIGKTKAKVFPLPVGAETHISEGRKNFLFADPINWGITCLCTGKKYFAPLDLRICKMLPSSSFISSIGICWSPRSKDTMSGCANHFGSTLRTLALSFASKTPNFVKPVFSSESCGTFSRFLWGHSYIT